MQWPDLRALGPAGNVAVFATAAAVVWVAGDRLARHAKVLADRTRLGQAFIGTMLLGVMVSLPEATLAAVSAVLGNAELAVNSLLGGVGMTMVVLAITDLAVGKEPLSVDVQHPVVLLQGAMVIVLLTVTAAGITAGDRLLPGIGVAGAWTTALLALYLASLMIVKRVQRHHPWTADVGPRAAEETRPHENGEGSAVRGSDGGRGIGRLLCFTVLAAAAVFAAGTVLAFSADALVRQTGLAPGFVGLIFGGVATSLPELSTTISAVRLKQYEMTFSDAFGTNLCSLALLFLADALYGSGAILNEVGRFSLFAVLLGSGLTAVYLAGLVARRKRPVWRMGIDSIIVLAASAAGFVMLYRLR